MHQDSNEPRTATLPQYGEFKCNGEGYGDPPCDNWVEEMLPLCLDQLCPLCDSTGQLVRVFELVELNA